MENWKFPQQSAYTTQETIEVNAVSDVRKFMAPVFTYMTIALILTALTSYFLAQSEAFLSAVYRTLSEGGIKPTLFGYIVMFSPLIMVIVMGAGFRRMSFPAIFAMFFVYSVVMGMSLTSIFFIYTGAVLFKTFLITSATFGIMAVAGYTTKTDLTKFGAILMMALIGVIIASVVNMFWYSGTLDMIISIVGVLIFTGLVAYDIQKLKRIAEGSEYGSDNTNKLAVFGALNLYLDFVNLFLFLLRFMGNSRD